MRIPSDEHVARCCTTDQYRRCTLYRRFVGLAIVKPDRLRAGEGGGR